MMIIYLSGLRRNDVNINISAFIKEHMVTLISVGYNFILAIIIFLVSLIVARMVSKAISRSNERLHKLDETLIPILCTTASYLVYAIGGVFILDIFGINTTSIIALLGAAGLAVGLALKDTLSNVAAGIMLIFLRPFRVGDYINFGNVTGTVKEINLFTTILCTYDGLYVSSPNNTILTNSITNYTRNGKRRMDITVGISYDDSIDKGLAVLQNVIDTESVFLKDPAPMAIVTSMGESSIDLQLRAWTKLDDYWSTLWRLNKRIKEDIEQAGLTIPYPHRSLQINTIPANPSESNQQALSGAS